MRKSENAEREVGSRQHCYFRKEENERLNRIRYGSVIQRIWNKLKEGLYILRFVCWLNWRFDSLCVGCLLVVHQSQEISQKHCDGNLTDGWNI